MADSILTPPQEQRLAAIYDDMVVRAESPPPSASDERFNKDGKFDPKLFKAAQDAYRDNPLLDRLKGNAEQKIVGLEEQALADVGGDKEKARELYAYKKNEMREAFIKGAQRGAPNPDSEVHQNNAFEALKEGDITGAIKSLVMSIPFVGDFLAGIMKMAKSWITGERLGFGQAQERIKLERALDGGLADAGVDPAKVQHYSDKMIHIYEHPDAVPPAAETPATAGAPATAAPVAAAPPSGARIDPGFNAPNGATPPPPAATPAAGAAPVASR